MERELSILVIEDDQKACKRFEQHAEVMENLSITACTANSDVGVQLVRDKLPDVVILDLELNDGRGSGEQFLCDMEKLSLPYKPYIVVTTYNSSLIVYDYVRKMGADRIIYKHKPDYSEKMVLEFLLSMKDTIQMQNKEQDENYDVEASVEQREARLRNRIQRELTNVGINHKLKGYHYLEDAIMLAINGEDRNICVAVGKLNGATDSSVERAMQNAINKAWRTADTEDLLKYYKARIDSERGNPTLTEFIYYYRDTIGKE